MKREEFEALQRLSQSGMIMSYHKKYVTTIDGTEYVTVQHAGEMMAAKQGEALEVVFREFESIGFPPAMVREIGARAAARGIVETLEEIGLGGAPEIIRLLHGAAKATLAKPFDCRLQVNEMTPEEYDAKGNISEGEAAEAGHRIRSLFDELEKTDES